MQGNSGDNLYNAVIHKLGVIFINSLLTFLMREDLEHNFDLAEFNASCRVMKCARQLFPHSEAQAERWAIHAYNRWINGQAGSPEEQRDSRCPAWKENLEKFEKRRQNTKLHYY